MYSDDFDPFAPQPPAETPAPAPTSVQPQSPAAFFAARIAAVKAELGPYEDQIDGLNAQVSALEVKDAESEALILKLGLPLDKLYKAIDKRRKEIVDEPNAYVKSINALAKFFLDKIDLGRKESRNKLAVYARAKALEAQKKADEERRARAELQARLDAEAARMNAEAKAKGETAAPVEAPKLPEAPPPEQVKTVRSEEGSATTVKTWNFKVADPSAVPREYLIVDEKAIRKAVKDGIRLIPGVEIFEETSIRFTR